MPLAGDLDAALRKFWAINPTTTMLCQLCHDMLHLQNGRRGTGVGEEYLTFSHQKNLKNLKASADKASCYLCSVVYDRLTALGSKHQYEWEMVSKENTALSASLYPVPDTEDLYRLDVNLNDGHIIASFALKQQASSDSEWRGRGPPSYSTSDLTVLELAKKWIQQCEAEHPKCRQNANATWFPSRLIDMRLLHENGVRAVTLVSTKEQERRQGQPVFEGRYVTLSHRWGSTKFNKLTRETLPKFQDGIMMQKLPLSFQQAMDVASALGVRWIWIDALCIMQKDKDKDKDDWLYESSTMDQVYAHSYCNISATAAMDGSQGLYSHRKRSKFWADDVSLETRGLGGVDTSRIVRCTMSDLSFWDDDVENAPVNKRAWVLQERLLAPRVLHWCKDQIAFECRTWDQAECRPQHLPHLLLRDGQLIDQARLKGIDMDVARGLRQTRLANQYGLGSRQLREGMRNVDKKLLLYEIWKRVVERYTKMELTLQGDRTIALAGIARMMNSTLQSQRCGDTYLAGMWQNYLASQLLWNVNDGNGKDSQPFEKTRLEGEDYRAPSFSWASIETPRGVTFPDTTDQGLLIRVLVVRLTYLRSEDKFGLLTGGYLVVRGVLRKIELHDTQQRRLSCNMTLDFNTPSIYAGLTVVAFLSLTGLLSLLLVGKTTRINQHYKTTSISIWCISAAMLCLVGIRYLILASRKSNKKAKPRTARYYWRMFTAGQPSEERYQVVHLDSPASSPSIFGPNAQVYCLPTLQDKERLWCLLLQATDGDFGIRYRRIGIAKVQNVHDTDVKIIKEPPGDNSNPLGEYYWGSEGRFRNESTICII